MEREAKREKQERERETNREGERIEREREVSLREGGKE